MCECETSSVMEQTLGMPPERAPDFKHTSMSVRPVRSAVLLAVVLTQYSQVFDEKIYGSDCGVGPRFSLLFGFSLVPF